VLVKTVIPAILQSVQFDPTDDEHYVTGPLISFFNDAVEQMVSSWSSSSQRVKALAFAILDTATRVSDGLNGNDIVVVGSSQEGSNFIVQSGVGLCTTPFLFTAAF
jgi:hypothetical protein